MSNTFIDAYMPPEIQGMPCNVSPRFSTRIVVAKSGDEARNMNWESPLRRFLLPEAVQDSAGLEAALSFWLVMGGPFATWPFRDPFDFASAPLEEPNVVPFYEGSDQALGTGDGFTSAFQMVKVRTIGPASFSRTISMPILDTIEVLVEGVLPGDVAAGAPFYGPYAVESITRPGGIVTFTSPLHAGVTATWGGLFDTEVRWEADDSFDAIVHSLATTGASPINLVEVRRC